MAVFYRTDRVTVHSEYWMRGRGTKLMKLRENNLRVTHKHYYKVNVINSDKAIKAGNHMQLNVRVSAALK